jgi:6-phosphofructo-2-kinase/fructose-2,6-biphosphatase 2
VIANNIKKVKIHGLDYANMTSEEAENDFQQRIAKYEEHYKMLNKDEGYSYVKIINVGSGI